MGVPVARNSAATPPVRNNLFIDNLECAVVFIVAYTSYTLLPFVYEPTDNQDPLAASCDVVLMPARTFAADRMAAGSPLMSNCLAFA